ncbi:hypothetical protein F4776DRAFT_332710 [Hypoxylon sp. NC0597]|nr:hypothetical protein F4776DRAFT_332710 [Hypoxylon sp. NC0597]
MDPVTAIGLASSILTFVGFSYSLISGTYEIAKLGSTTGNDNVELVVKDLNKLTEELRKHELKGTSKHETALTKLALKCEALSGELLALLETLKAKEGFQWNTVKVALRSMRKKREVADKMAMLTEYRSEVLARLLSLLNERQTSTHTQLDRLLNDRHDGLVSRLESLQNALNIQAREQRGSGQTNDEEPKLNKIQEIQLILSKLLESSQQPSPDVRVLRQLYFSSMYNREDSVRDAGRDTFKWILDEEVGDITGRDDAFVKRLSEESHDRNEKWITEKIDHIRSLQSQTRSNFLKWLSRGNCIFHISGKAGSGKSTLMKLLAFHPRAQEELKRWSGNKRLIFAHFFAWSAGKDEMQNTLHGLCRSILFTVLKQCPDLISYVFPEAYQAFSTTQYEVYIDEPFFRLPSLMEALQKLSTVSMNRQYRFCFFIDGLDEFKNEKSQGTSHKKLADILTGWAANDNVKLLVSSRPTDEFMSSFSEKLRIKLHELTQLDIMRFGCSQFEKHMDNACVRSHYTTLVNEVSRNAQGVFLWAHLTIGIILSEMSRTQDIKKLQDLIDAIPEEVEDLYRSLLESIDRRYQRKVNKVLRLIGAVRGCPAVSITWADELLATGTSFPVTRDIETYSEEEIEGLVLEANRIVSQSKGLLEFMPSDQALNGSVPLCVTFSHRTVHEFVDQNEQMRSFGKGFPKLDRVRLEIKIHLAGLWFLGPKNAQYYFRALTQRLGDRNYWAAGDEDRYTWLDAFERTIQHHKGVHPTTFLGITGRESILPGFFFDSNVSLLPRSGTNFSFLHWVANRIGDWEYLRRKLQGEPKLVHADGNLSLLFSAALSWKEQSTVDHLLELGASPNESIMVHKSKVEDEMDEMSIWVAFCALLASYIIILDEIHPTHWHPMFKVLRTFLRAGEVDPEVSIVLGRGRGYRGFPGDGTHVISLKHLVQQFDPDNVDAWEESFNPAKNIFEELRKMWSYLATHRIYDTLCGCWNYAARRWTLGSLVAAWSYMTTRRSNSNLCLLRNKYLPYRLGMKPERLLGDKAVGLYTFSVYSVILGDVEILTNGIELQIY